MAKFKPGESGNPGGKPRGAQHKTTLAIAATFDYLQGKPGKSLNAWALENTTAFYTILYPKIIPKNIDVSGDAAFPVLMAALLNELASRYDVDPAIDTEYREVEQIEHQEEGQDEQDSTVSG